MMDPADETERSLPGVGIPVLGRPGVGIPDDRDFWLVDAYKDMTDFANWPTTGSCRSLHASSSSILLKAAHCRASHPQSVVFSHREATEHCRKDNTLSLRGDPTICFLFLRRKPCPAAVDTIPSRCSANPLGLARNRIPAITTRSKTTTRFFGTEEERDRSEDTRPSPSQGP